jgi:hypothetical protein
MHTEVPGQPLRDQLGHARQEDLHRPGVAAVRAATRPRPMRQLIIITPPRTPMANGR